MNKQSIIPGILGGVACIAIVLQMVRAGQDRQKLQATFETVVALKDELRKTRAEVGELRSNVRESKALVQATQASVRAMPPMPPPLPVEPEVPEIVEVDPKELIDAQQQMISELGERLAYLEAGMKQWLVFQQKMMLEGEIEASPELVAAMKQQVLNPNASEADRLQALRILRRNDERSPEVVASMIQMASTTESPRVRADIFRQMEGVEDPAFGQTLLQFAANDPNAMVREEAVESMEAFVSDPRYLEALTLIAEQDASDEVRVEAYEVLGRYARKLERQGQTGR